MRIRTTKPEFWRSADTAALSYFARLLFIGLWNYVDDNGVGEYNIALIRSDLFPREVPSEVEELITGALTELSLRAQIVVYECLDSGRLYFKVVNWHHQKINRPTPSLKPLPTSANVRIIDGSVNAHCGLTEGSPPDLGNKGTREQGNEVPGTARARGGEGSRPTMSITELATGRPEPKPEPAPPEIQRGAVASPAADLIREALPQNKYQPATLTALRISVSQLLNEGNDRAVVLKALQLWDADGGAYSPNSLAYKMTAATKALHPTEPAAPPPSPTAYQRKTARNAEVFAELAAKAAAQQDAPPVKELNP